MPTLAAWRLKRLVWGVMSCCVGFVGIEAVSRVFCRVRVQGFRVHGWGPSDL